MLAARAHVNAIHWDMSQNVHIKVHIMELDEIIMPVMEQANIVVSEESRAMIDALLLTNPAVYVSDVKITDTCLSPFAFLQQAQHAGSLLFGDRFRKHPSMSVCTVKHLLSIKRPLKVAVPGMTRSSAA